MSEGSGFGPQVTLALERIADEQCNVDAVPAKASKVFDGTSNSAIQHGLSPGLIGKLKDMYYPSQPPGPPPSFSGSSKEPAKD